MSSDDIEITITNPDGLAVKPVMVELPQYDEYLDKPRRFQAAIEKDSGLDPQGTAKVTRRGKIILLGHVKKLDESKPKKDTLLLQSAEALLEERIGQFYRYPAGTRLDAILGSSAGGSVVGLLCMANGLIPRGGWAPLEGEWYWIAGGGSSGRFGDITTLYQGTTPLTKVGVWTTAPAGSFYQDIANLAIRCTDGRSPAYHQIIAPNFKDTLLRIGTISLASTTFSVCYEIGETKIWPVIRSLILAAGLEYSIRYEKDGYAYLDASATVGQGSESAPVATYIDGDNAEISLDEMDGDGHIQALIGQGAGAGITQQCAAAFDFATAGTWREAIYQAGGMFGDMLQTATEKVFSDYSDPKIYKVDAPEQDWAQGCGNCVGIVRPGAQPVFKRIKHIAMKGGRMELEVGQRLRTLQEILKGKEEVQNVLASFYGAHTRTAWSWSLPGTNIDSYSPISHKFLLASTDDSTKEADDPTLGSGEIDPNFPFQVLLSLRIDWYKSSVKSATVSGPSHSTVGNHSGYGGVETSDEEMTAHPIPSKTSAASPTLYQVSSYQHGHSMGWANAYGNALNYISLWVDWITFNVWDGSKYVPYDVVEDVSFNDYDYDSFALDYHGHSLGQATYASDVSHQLHTHNISSYYTYAAGDQSHTEALKSAKTRAGSNQHSDQTLDENNQKIEFAVNDLATGSVKLMSLTVKCNGSHVPGSPFTDGGAGLYIGDSLDSIDISSLVNVGETNEITVQVAAYGAADPVKCNISGNVNVSAIISAF
jgi:hypothetical protein